MVMSDVHAGVFGDFLQHINIASDKIRFGDDGNAETVVASELLQASAGDTVFFFGGLIGIGRGTR